MPHYGWNAAGRVARRTLAVTCKALGRSAILISFQQWGPLRPRCGLPFRLSFSQASPGDEPRGERRSPLPPRSRRTGVAAAIDQGARHRGVDRAPGGPPGGQHDRALPERLPTLPGAAPPQASVCARSPSTRQTAWSRRERRPARPPRARLQAPSASHSWASTAFPCSAPGRWPPGPLRSAAPGGAPAAPSRPRAPPSGPRPGSTAAARRRHPAFPGPACRQVDRRSASRTPG